MTEKHIYYTFQCNYCFIISGISGKSTEDAPSCCHGEPMRPILHEISVPAPTKESEK